MPLKPLFTLQRLVAMSTFFALCVIIVGAYTRLTDAGLGCPDWPGCYGHWTVPSLSPLESRKAWTEMIHRYLASLLGFMILCITVGVRQKKTPHRPRIAAGFLLCLVLGQGLLGMWTVTLKLFPLVVMAHLLGGLSIVSLLQWLSLKLNPTSASYFKNTPSTSLKYWALFALAILILQIFLGGWTSANYAALVCLDFPGCQADFHYPYEWKEAFNFLKIGVPGSPGASLTQAAKVTLHMLHRINAVLTFIVLLCFGLRLLYCSPSQALRRWISLFIAVLCLQILLGIANVVLRLPLPVAVLHNASAALLLLLMIRLIYALFHPRKPTV